MKKLAVLLAAAPLLLCAPLASSADASSAGDPGAFVLSEAEVDQMARNTHDFNQAIAAGNAADVGRLLSTGITPNIVLENGDTPLTWALRSESWDLARVLLDAQGIDVNMENRHGETPLMLAVIKGREAEFDRLLKLGAKVNKTRGWTPLHYAATEGRTSMMKRLIELGADVNAQTKAGITALDMAARKPSREAVMMLLRAGAYRDYCTDRGMSAADFAKKAGDEELAKYLAVKTCAVTAPPDPSSTGNPPASRSVTDARPLMHRPPDARPRGLSTTIPRIPSCPTRLFPSPLLNFSPPPATPTPASPRSITAPTPSTSAAPPSAPASPRATRWTTSRVSPSTRTATTPASSWRSTRSSRTRSFRAPARLPSTPPRPESTS